MSACHEALAKCCQCSLIWAGAIVLMWPLFFLFPRLSQLIISHSHLLIWTDTCCNLALEPMASAHAYFCTYPVLGFSAFWSHLIFVSPSESRYFFCFQVFKAAFVSSAKWKSWWAQHDACSSLTAYLLLICCLHTFQRIDCRVPLFLSVFPHALSFVWLLHFGENVFHWPHACAAINLSSPTSTKPQNPSTCPFTSTTFPASIPIILRKIIQLQ